MTRDVGSGIGLTCVAAACFCGGMGFISIAHGSIDGALTGLGAVVLNVALAENQIARVRRVRVLTKSIEQLAQDGTDAS